MARLCQPQVALVMRPLRYSDRRPLLLFLRDCNGEAMNRRSFLYAVGATAVVHPSLAWGTSGQVQTVSTPAGEAQPLDETERDPFRRAVVTGDLQNVKRFVERDPALIYSRNTTGESIYLLACYAQQKAVAEYLLSKGLRLDFHEAVAGGHWKIVDQELSANPGYALSRNPRGDSPSHTAVLARQSDYLIQFVTYARDFNAKSSGRQDRTPVHLAAACPRAEDAEPLMQNLLQNGGSATSVDRDGNTPLHLCAATNNLFAARMLLRKGASPIARNNLDETPLEVARRSKVTEMVGLFEDSDQIPRDYYAGRFAARRDGTTVQRDDTQGLPQSLVNEFVIVSHFNAERMQKLLQQCPDLLNTRSSFDELAVEAGAHMGRRDIAGLLLDRGAPYSICTAVMFGETNDVKRMLQVDPLRIHERGPHDFLLTFYPAFGTGSIEMMELLLANGARLDWNVRERNPLHVAAEFGQADLCRYLAEKGLNPRQKAFTFKGHLDAIELARGSKHPEIAEMLATR